MKLALVGVALTGLAIGVLANETVKALSPKKVIVEWPRPETQRGAKTLSPIVIDTEAPYRTHLDGQWKPMPPGPGGVWMPKRHINGKMYHFGPGAPVAR